jgi:hypothetical protein
MNLTILTDYFVVKLLQFNILLQCNLGHFLDSLHFLTGFLCNLINDKHSVWLYAVKGPVKDLWRYRRNTLQIMKIPSRVAGETQIIPQGLMLWI